MKIEWPSKRLRDICEIIMGQSPDGVSYNTTGAGVPLINGPVEFSDDSFGKTVRAKFTTQPTKYCKEGDLILCIRGSTTGRMNIAGFDACIGRGVAAIRAKQYQPWINYYISSIREEIYLKGTGATFPNVSGATLGDFRLVVPPLPEQRRIVGILDEAFDGIATAKANAEKNLQNTRAIFESHLQSVFTQRGPGWVEKKLGEVCDFEGGSQPPKSQFLHKPKAGYVRFLQIRDFGSDKHITYIPESKKNRLCREGDIMIGRYGASVGKILTGLAGAYNVALIKTLPDTKVISRDFFHHYLISNSFQMRLFNVADRSAQNGFSKDDIYDFPVPVPALGEQQDIVGRLRPLRAEIQRLASLYERKLALFDALKKSLLYQAFSGRL